MSFQFQCPRGHLLEGDESQAGQQCNCPMCGMLFIIPMPVSAPPPVGPPQVGPSNAPYYQPLPPQVGPSNAPSYEQYEPGPPASPFAHLQTGPAAAAEEPPPSGPAFGGEKVEAPPELLHIPCPKGHELETPPEMLDQEVLCPQCGVQFLLRRKDSVEFKKALEAAETLRLAKLGNFWLNWAIAAVVLVVLGLITMIIISNLGDVKAPKK